LPALAGANLIYGLGMLESGITLGYGQMVMDSEFAGMVRYTLQGIPVNDETLDVDSIIRVGPGGNHLTEPNTVAKTRGYQSAPKFIDRNLMDNWLLEGGVDLKTKCDEEARRILETHQPEPLSEYAAGTIREIIEKEERDLGITQ
jgi:trimethylamine--corrinoid protein Co-methyltransferase